MVFTYGGVDLSREMADEVCGVFERVCRSHGCELVEFEVEGRSVRLLVEGNPNVVVSRLVNTMKTISSRLLRNRYGREFFWEREYCVFSEGACGELLHLVSTL